MTVIAGLGQVGAGRIPVRRDGVGGFAMPAGAARAGAAGPAPSLAGLVALQELGQEATQAADIAAARDREARRHGAAMLVELVAMQRALLGGEASADRLAALIQNAPAPADKRLAAVQRALLVRAAVEVARRAAARG